MTKSAMHTHTAIAYAIYSLLILGATGWFTAAGVFVSFMNRGGHQDFVERTQALLSSMFSAEYLICFVIINGSCLPFHYAMLHVIDGEQVPTTQRWKKAVVMQSLAFATSFVIMTVLL